MNTHQIKTQKLNLQDQAIPQTKVTLESATGAKIEYQSRGNSTDEQFILMQRALDLHQLHLTQKSLSKPKVNLSTQYKEWDAAEIIVGWMVGTFCFCMILVTFTFCLRQVTPQYRSASIEVKTIV